MCDYHLRRSIIVINYREIRRLHSLGFSQREIAVSVHNSRDKVSEVIHLACGRFKD